MFPTTLQRLIHLIVQILLFVATDCEIQLVQVFFRHGERPPTTYVKFPNEPDSILENFPYEPGELTNRGIQQEFTLGKNLRDEYAKIVGYKYRPSQLRVYTGMDNRTITSAQIVLASFLPPTPDQEWNPSLNWQPVPVVTQPIIDHVSFGIFDHCPTLKESLVSKPEYNIMFNYFSSIVQELQEKTGAYIPDLYIFQKVIDGVKTRKMLEYLLPLPKWYVSSDNFISQVDSIQDDLHTQFMDLFIDSIGGWHYDQILGKMDDFIHNRTKHKIIFYSGHDTNTLTLCRFLNINKVNYALPPLSSYVAVELHKVNGNHFVQMYYHPQLNGTRIGLEIPDCPSPCPYLKFASLKTRLSTEQWVEICLGISLHDQCTLFGSIAGGLLILVVLLVGAVLALLWSCCDYKSKYELLSDPERKPLVQ